MNSQDYQTKEIRSSAILTTSYVAGEVLGPSNISPIVANQMNLLVGATIGNLTSIEIKIEYSNDGSTYYQETFESISGGVSTLSAGVYSITASGNYTISVPIKYPYIKVSAKGTGTVTNSALSIFAILGNS